MDIQEHDLVRVVCKDRTITKSEASKIFEGKVVSVFNALDKNGDNYIIEIRASDGSWFLYKPNIDGGTITKVEPNHNFNSFD